MPEKGQKNMPVDTKTPRPTLLMIEQRIDEIVQATADTLDGIEDEQEAALFKEKMDELIADLQDGLAEKIDAYGLYISKWEAESERLADINRNLQDRKKRADNRISRAKAHLLDTMFSADVKKLEGNVFIARFTSSESVVVDDADKLPEDLVRVKRDPDKTAIKKALKDGAEVSAAHIQTNYNVNVKSK